MMDTTCMCLAAPLLLVKPFYKHSTSLAETTTKIFLSPDPTLEEEKGLMNEVMFLYDQETISCNVTRAETLLAWVFGDGYIYETISK